MLHISDFDSKISQFCPIGGLDTAKLSFFITYQHSIIIQSVSDDLRGLKWTVSQLVPFGPKDQNGKGFLLRHSKLLLLNIYSTYSISIKIFRTNLSYEAIFGNISQKWAFWAKISKLKLNRDMKKLNLQSELIWVKNWWTLVFLLEIVIFQDKN